MLKFQTHINVEICSTVCAVKYIYKYIYKEHNRAIIEFQSGKNADQPRQVDEISNYLEDRYFSASEACYQIFYFEFHSNLPHAMRLAIHIENQKSVCFSDHTDPGNFINTEKDPTLTGCCFANQGFSSARNISYLDLSRKSRMG